tara:strand:+ start:348 stop:806 length:459 start_codon:yes stop_codon:yes gene_type:complete
MTKQKIKLISHRGNVNGQNIERENTLSYIDEANFLGYDVEIDVWMSNGYLYLGHDCAKTRIDYSCLVDRQDFLWIHCKNFQALSFLSSFCDLKTFFHENERYTYISNGVIWAHDISDIDNNCIIPLLEEKQILDWTKQNVYGICSDYVELFK